MMKKEEVRWLHPDSPKESVSTFSKSTAHSSQDAKMKLFKEFWWLKVSISPLQTPLLTGKLISTSIASSRQV